MWNILQTANRRAKRMKLWDSGYYSAYMQGTFDARLLEFGLRSFGALCKISNFTIFLKLCSSHNFRPIHPNFMQGIIIIQAVTIWRSAKNCKKYGTLNLTQDHMQLEFSKCYFSHANFMRTLFTMVNVNACQNTAMRSWHLESKITYSI